LQDASRSKGLNAWLLQRVLHWGERPAAIWVLFLGSIVQSGLFPVPVLLLFVTFSLGALERTFRFALACAAGSILGGCLAYFLGYSAWGVVKDFFIPHLFSETLLARAEQLYQGNIFYAMLLISFSPLSYLMSSIAAGVLKVNFWHFVASSFVARTLRFLFIGALIRIFGERARRFIEHHLPVVGWVLVLIVLAGAIVLYLIRRLG